MTTWRTLNRLERVLRDRTPVRYPGRMDAADRTREPGQPEPTGVLALLVAAPVELTDGEPEPFDPVYEAEVDARIHQRLRDLPPRRAA